MYAQASQTHTMVYMTIHITHVSMMCLSKQIDGIYKQNYYYYYIQYGTITLSPAQCLLLYIIIIIVYA